MSFRGKKEAKKSTFFYRYIQYWERIIEEVKFTGEQSFYKLFNDEWYNVKGKFTWNLWEAVSLPLVFNTLQDIILYVEKFLPLNQPSNESN